MVGNYENKYTKFELKCYHHHQYHNHHEYHHQMSNQNLKNLYTNKTRPCNLLKPITYSNLCHRHHKRTVPKQSDKIFQTQRSNGIVFIWPQRRRKYYYEKELCVLTKLIAHVLYWLHIANLFPGCAGIILKQPPWHYKPPLSKPENRDFIIEPDWHSQYL